MWQIFLGFVAVLRLTTPLIIYLNPIAATLVSLSLDSVDGYLAFRSKWQWKTYHVYDKLMDYWWYIFILFYSTRLSIFPVILMLFALRTIGQLLTLATHKSIFLFWFPNILENYFIAYELSWIFPGLSPLFNNLNQAIPLSICIIVAIWREYILHVKKIYAANYIFGLNLNWAENQSSS